jgi:hypothetical protein
MHDENYDVLLNLGTSNSPAGPAREYVLRYRSQRHPEANLFRRLEQRLWDRKWNIRHTWTQAAHGLYGHSQWSCHNCSCGVSYALPHERCHYPSRGSSKCFVTIVYRCNFANSHISTLRTSSYSHNIVCRDEAYFMSEGLFNVHKNHPWARDKPHAIRESGYQVGFSVSIWDRIVVEWGAS